MPILSGSIAISNQQFNNNYDYKLKDPIQSQPDPNLKN
jgi:hypothetical protein